MKKVFLTIAMAFLIGGLCIQCSSSDAKSAASTQTKEATPDQPQTIQSDMTTQSLEIDDAAANGKVIHLTQEGFKQKVFDFSDPNAVYEGNIPVVVDCSTSWCGWCKKMAPHLAALAKKYDGRIIFYEIDMDQARELGKAMEIEGYPTLLLIKPNSRAEQLVGYHDKDELEAAFNEAFFE